MKLTKTLNCVSCLLILAVKQASACQQGNGTNTVLLLPSLGGTIVQASALNAAGQVTGFSYLAGNTEAHAFLYNAGTVTDLGTFGGVFSQGFAINAAGQVAGSADTASETHAALYNGTTLLDLGTLGGSFSSAAVNPGSINNAGMVVGDSLTSGDSSVEAFVYANGSMTGLGDLGGGSSSATAINQNGHITGDSFNMFAEDHAFFYSNGTMTDLGTLGGASSVPHAINDSDMVVGESETLGGETHAFAWTSGPMTDLGTLGGTGARAFAVNNVGQIIGDSDTAGGESHAFIYSNGTMTDLGTLGGTHSAPQAINNLGQVVGDAAIVGGQSHAFLWENGTMIDLNSTLLPNSGWVLNGAQLINDAGRIVGFGTFNGQDSVFILDLSHPNNAPVANAGTDQNVECQTQVTLDGTQSSDPDNDLLAYEWSEGTTVLGTSPTLAITLPIGVHTITLTVTDPCGSSAQDTVVVTVSDTVAPSSTCPGAVTVSVNANCQAAVPNVSSQVVASDNCTATGSLVITQNPAAGTLLGLGNYTIVVTVTDESGNSSTCNTPLHVVDTTAPVIVSGPALGTLSANNQCQAAVPNVVPNIVATDNCTAANALTIVQNPLAGTLVGLGSHSITVTVTDASGNSVQGSLSFTVADTTAPTITSAPSLVSASAGANCQGTVPNVTGQVVASDNCTAAGSLTVSQNPTAGTLLGVGQYNIIVTVTDAAGNSATTTVVLKVADTTAPTITSAPGLVTAPAGANCQGVVPNVTGQVVASDNCTAAGSLTISQSPTAGTLLGVGQYNIIVTVTDAAGNSATTTVVLKVADTTAPTVTSAPSLVTVTAGANCQGVVPDVTSQVVASDNCTAAGSLTVSQSPAAGTLLGVGQYNITVTVTDAAGNSATTTVVLKVETSVPTIQSVTANPSVLSPPNHQLVPVTVSVVASGGCDSSLVSQIISVTANESTDPGDIQITGNLTVTLAASKNSMGNNRVYTITVRTTDSSGNSATATTTVSVLKSNGNSNGSKP